MKTLVTIPEDALNRMQEYRKKYYSHLSLGKFLVHFAIEAINSTEGKKNDN